MIRTLRAGRHPSDDLVADVDVHAKAARWPLEFPEDGTVQEDVANAVTVLDRGLERAKQLPRGERLHTYPQGSCLSPTPGVSTTGALNAGQFQLDVFARGYSMPTPGDIAVLVVKEGADAPDVAFAGFLDEAWKIRE